MTAAYYKPMKIGVFDSGLGGLLILKSLTEYLPQYDYVYLGDTARMPYGNRTQTEIYTFTKQAMEFLFNQEARLIIIACNTASSRALRKLQQEFLPKKHPNKKILGVIIPTAEAAVTQKNLKRIGVLATAATVNSKAYEKELKKLNPKIAVSQQSAPKLATAIEFLNTSQTEKLTRAYLASLVKKNPDAVILGCTHYSVIKSGIKKMLPKNITVIDQANVIPPKLKTYLKKHPEITKTLSTKKHRQLFVTQSTPHNTKLAKTWFGSKAKLNTVTIH